MAMTKCKECGKDVSTKADSCPHCGNTQKSKSFGCGSIILLLIVLSIVGSMLSYCNEQSAKKAEIKKAEKLKLVNEQNKNRLEEKQKQVAVDFVSNIEKHYAELVSYYDNNQFDDFDRKIIEFKSYNKLDYRDIKDRQGNIITKKNEEKILVLEKRLDSLEPNNTFGYVETYRELYQLQRDNQEYKDKLISYLEKQVKSIPASQYEKNFYGYGELSRLNPENLTYKNKEEFYKKKHYAQVDKRMELEREESLKASSDLEVVSSHWSVEYDYAIYEGQVKNISGSPMKAVQAVVTWYDKNGTMITSDSSFIKYNPILAGQTSPFKVMETYNPAMEKAGVEFSYFAGGKIKTYQK